ncbi:MAG: hypothetical protein HY725_05440 [Candidatus Rokubacteria bacterium]|nr:hypothetical protein [Candidatus Rokubacteria bacterium]
MALKASHLTFFLVMAGQALAAAEPAPSTKGAQVGSEAMQIHVDHGRLTVKLEGIPLETVLKEIGRRAGIEIAILGPLTKNTSMEFRDLPLAEGLRKLLRGFGWALLQAGSAPQSGALEKVIVVPGGERAGFDQGASGPKGERTLAQAVTALLEREQVKTLLDVYLHGSSARARRDAFRGLLGAVQLEDLELLIELLEDQSVQPAEWEAALAPLSGVIRTEERWFILRSLQSQVAREQMVKTLESHVTYKRRAEAKR